MNVRHKKTGEEFEWQYDSRTYVILLDKNGELRRFKKEVLERIEPIEEWEDVPVEDILYNRMGNVLVKVWCQYEKVEDGMALGIPEYRTVWTKVPYSSVRIMNGRIQRKKKEV